MNAVGLHDVANEGGHGDTAVLDLGVAQVADRRLVAAINHGIRKTQRIVEANGRVQLLSQHLKVGLRLHTHRGGGDGRRAHTGGGREGNGAREGREHG